jgi:hypothetical protein
MDEKKLGITPGTNIIVKTNPKIAPQKWAK